MAYNEGLAERIRAAVRSRHAVVEKKMFGGLAFMLNDHMFCGVLGESLMARVGPEHYSACLARPHVREMDFTGRALRGYVYVDPAGIQSDSDLHEWLSLCADFVLTLPPKNH